MNTSNIIIQSSSPTWLNNVILLSIVNGNYSFTVIADKVGTFVITIYLHSDKCIPDPIMFEVLINIVPIHTFEPEINYPSELTVGESLFISCNQWLSINNESVTIDEVLIFNDSLSIEYTPIDLTEFSFIISINTENFTKGFHELTLRVFSYGHENQSINVFIEIIGREIVIEIEVFPQHLIQGSDFIVKAILTYVPLQYYSGGFGSGLSLVPLEGVSVSFLINIKYENGTIIPLYYDNTTNDLGESIITVTSKYSLSAEGIENITVTTAGTASGKESTKSTPSNFFENHKFEKKRAGIPEELFILGIMGLILGIILSSIGFFSIRKRNQRQEIDSIAKAPPSLAPEAISLVKENDEDEVQIEPQIDRAERIRTIVKKYEEIPEIVDQEILIPSWITQFPPTIHNYENEIRFLFNLIMKREGRWHGRTSYNFLQKHKTDDISVTNLKKVYMILPQETSYFKKEKTSIVITEEGKKIASSILESNDQ